MDFSNKHYGASIDNSSNSKKKRFRHYLLKDETKKFFKYIYKSIQIYAVVKVDNLPSIKLFTIGGYSFCDIDIDGFAKYITDFK